MKVIKALIKDFLLMLQFLTRVPINLSLPCEKENFKRGTMFFPVVGLVIGFFQWIVFFLLIRIFPSNTVAIFVLLVGILITGGLHIDGLGDTCDGFFAFKGKERIIEIMKDSRIGTYSCIAIIIDLLLKYTSTTNLIVSGYSLGIIAAPVIAKTAFIFLFYIGKQAKAIGTGNLFIGNVGKKELLIATTLGCIITAILIGTVKALIITLICFILTYVFNKFCESKIDGLTGDTLGANNEIIEIVTLMLVLAVQII
jgi:adenosylcobinamide-GDP ribazoletransferase